MPDINDVVMESRNREIEVLLRENTNLAESMGYTVEFGNIGKHTTYALLTHKVTGQELVGYTFVRNLKYYRENVGKLKALQQAIARQQVSEQN